MRKYTFLYTLKSLTDDTKILSDDVAVVVTARGEYRITADGTITLDDRVISTD